MGWRVLILQGPASGGRSETGHAIGTWKIVPPADGSLTMEEARDLATDYGWPNSANVKMEGYDEPWVGGGVQENPVDESHIQRATVMGVEKCGACEHKEEEVGSIIVVDPKTKKTRSFETRGVLGGAYKGKSVSKRELLEHAYEVTLGKWGAEKTLCGKVTADHLNDEDEHAWPSCPECAKKLTKLGASKGSVKRAVEENPRAEATDRPLPPNYTIGTNKALRKSELHKYTATIHRVDANGHASQTVLFTGYGDTPQEAKFHARRQFWEHHDEPGSGWPPLGRETQTVAIRPFSGPDYLKRERKGGGPDTTQCALCGKWIRDDSWRYTVHVLDGGARFASTQEEFDYGGGMEGGDMGVWPVGPDCAKVLKAAGVYVHNEKTGRAKENPTRGRRRQLNIGDRVWVIKGARRGLTGVVTNTTANVITVQFDVGQWKGREEIFPRSLLSPLGQRWQTNEDRHRPEEARENPPRHAADYSDIEAALLGAQSKFDATHATKYGEAIFSPTSKGYIKRVGFKEKGFYHWPEQGTIVNELPQNAEMIYRLVQVGWDPEVAPEAMPVSQRRAAEEASFKLGDRVIMLAGKTIGMGRLKEDWPGEIDRVEVNKQGGVFYGVSYVDRKGKRKHTYADPHELRHAEARENPVEASNGAGWAKITRDPKAHGAAMARAASIGSINNAKAVYELLSPELIKEDQEVFLVLPLDIRGNLRCDPVEVHRGARSRVDVSVPDVLRAVIEAGGEGFCVVHNHPTGLADPSKADGDLTKAIRKGAEAVDLALVDHVVIGHGQYYSFEDKKLHHVKGKKS